MFKLPKVLILDYNKWRCGKWSRDDNNRLGCGGTSLKNSQGSMCCLGQFCQQAKIKELFYDEPCDIDKLITGLTKYKKYKGDTVSYITNTKLSESAMGINDDENTTVAEKVRKLKSLFQKRGYTIRLKNFPARILKEIKQ